MIEISHLTKIYNRQTRALDDVNLKIEEGMFGLIGPNGAGKTTLMRTLAGILRPTSGKAYVMGQDIETDLGKRIVRSTLGYLPQELGLYPELTAVEFLEYIALLKGISNASKREAQLAEVLEIVGLGKDATRRIKSFSGGMKRRIGIAQALLGQPELLIVDEPTAGLDPEERSKFRNLLVSKASHCTVIFSTHIIEDINQSCTYIAVIEGGHIRFHGNPRDLISQAQGHVFTVTAKTTPPDPSLLVVSSLQTKDGMEYRIVGIPHKNLHAKPAEPNLEDSYLWLLHKSRSKLPQP